MATSSAMVEVRRGDGGGGGGDGGGGGISSSGVVTGSTATGVESERLLNVLESAVRALELLAMLPTAEMSVAEAAWLLDPPRGEYELREEEKDEELSCGLAPETIATLSRHLRLESSLLQHEQLRQQRRRSSTTIRSTTTIKPTHTEKKMINRGADSTHSNGPEVVEEDEEEEEDNDDGEKEEENDPAEEDDDEEEEEDDLWRAFPSSLHRVVNLLTHNKPARDTLRRLTATSISADVASLVHALTDLIQISDRRLLTSVDQDDAHREQLRSAALRLSELEDDASQLRHELKTQRETRQHHSLTSAAMIASLHEQLRTTQRHAQETMRTTQRERELSLQALRSQFESETIRSHEQLLALQRMATRVDDTHEMDESDATKRQTRVAIDVNALVAQYDTAMAGLDDEIHECQVQVAAMARELEGFALHFASVDDDRTHQLEELRAWEEEQKKRDRLKFCMLRVVSKLQAVVRGWLTRRRVRLHERIAKNKKKKKKLNKKNKNTKTKKKQTITTTGRTSMTTSSMTTTTTSTALRRPQRPSSATAATVTAAATATARRPPRPSSSSHSSSAATARVI